MNDAGLREHDESVGAAGFGVVQQLAGGADEVGQIQQRLDALRMGDHLGVWMLQLQFEQGFFAEGFMHDAAPWPEGELPAALILDPAPQIAVGGKQNRAIGG